MISVLIPTLDRDVLLAEALASLVAQRGADWEALVVDNGQRPATRRVVADFGDERLRYIAAPRNLGECGGRNLALRHSRGAFVCFLDDDDRLPPDSLARRRTFLERHAACGMIYARYALLEGDYLHPEPAGRDEAPYRHKAYYDRLLARVDFEPAATHALLKRFNFVRGGTPLVRRSTLERVGPFDERLEMYGDYDMWLRLAATSRLRFLDVVVYHYRRHPGSISRRLLPTERDRDCALYLCHKHGIRRSVQFARYQPELDRMWAGATVAPPG